MWCADFPSEVANTEQLLTDGCVIYYFFFTHKAISSASSGLPAPNLSPLTKAWHARVSEEGVRSRSQRSTHVVADQVGKIDIFRHKGTKKQYQKILLKEIF